MRSREIGIGAGLVGSAALVVACGSGAQPRPSEAAIQQFDQTAAAVTSSQQRPLPHLTGYNSAFPSIQIQYIGEGLGITPGDGPRTFDLWPMYTDQQCITIVPPGNDKLVAVDLGHSAVAQRLNNRWDAGSVQFCNTDRNNDDTVVFKAEPA